MSPDVLSEAGHGGVREHRSQACPLFCLAVNYPPDSSAQDLPIVRESRMLKVQDAGQAAALCAADTAHLQLCHWWTGFLL